MERILKNINAVVGVIGCFVCNDEGETLVSAVPAIFDETMLSAVNRTVIQIIAGLETVREEQDDNEEEPGDNKEEQVDSVVLSYKEGRLIIKNLHSGCLCVLCARRINIPLLNLTTDVAAKKLIAKQQEHIKEAVIEIPKTVDGKVEASFFAILDRELAKAIGPLAGLVVNREVQFLGESRESFSTSEVSTLLDRISNRIDDEDKRLQFQQARQKSLKAFLP